MFNLGELPVENETIDFTHSTNQNLLAHYHKVTINVVSNVDRNLPLFMGELKVGHRLKAGHFVSLSFFGNFESLVWLTRFEVSEE